MQLHLDCVSSILDDVECSFVDVRLKTRALDLWFLVQLTEVNRLISDSFCVYTLNTMLRVGVETNSVLEGGSASFSMRKGKGYITAQ